MLVSGGRYGLSSKELTPGMVAGIFAELARERPRRRFTIGIIDDVSGLSLPYDPSMDIEPPGTIRAVFLGLGSDGTVGANKNTIKILGAEENLHAQGYFVYDFVYDSKKSGSQTVSHLRFGPQPIRAPYLVSQASFVGCHHFGLLDRAECSAGRHRARRCCSTARSRPTRSGMRCPGRVQEKILRRVAAGRRAAGFPFGAAGHPRPAGYPVHSSGVRGGLHRMRAVCPGLPGHRAG